MTDITNPPSDPAPPGVRALLLELTTFEGTLVSGDYLARRAAVLLGIPAPQHLVYPAADLVADTMHHAQLQALGQQQKGGAP